jgi:hypothetical protein
MAGEVMDWPTYKRLCDRPDVWSRWMLEQTAALLADVGLRARLGDFLDAAPLAKPTDHRGGAATDMFTLDLTVVEVAAIRGEIEAARHRGATSPATRARGLGGFVEAWTEYHRFLEGVRGSRATGG